MTFRKGYALAAYTVLMNHRAFDTDGKPVHPENIEQVYITTSTLVEVEEPEQSKYERTVRFPYPGLNGTFMVAEVPAYGIADVRAEYAELRIEEIEQETQTRLVHKYIAGWIERKTRIAWPEKPPVGLSVDEFVTPISATQETFTVETSTLANVAVPIAGFDPNAISFERTKEEVDERNERLTTGKTHALLSADEALALLRTVDLLRAYLDHPQTVVVAVAETDGEFEAACAKYLLSAPQFKSRKEQAIRQASLVNAFADTRGKLKKILLRPGAQGIGTEAHELLHTQNGPLFDSRANFFLSEGVTEYLTRMATDGTYNREDRYETEYFFIAKLVEFGATGPAALAALYFADDWTGFENGIRGYAGDFVSIEVLLNKAENERPYAVIDYLEELHKNPAAPVDWHAKQSAQ